MACINNDAILMSLVLQYFLLFFKMEICILEDWEVSALV